MKAEDFFLGTHMPHWLFDKRFSSVPLFIARQRLNRRKKLESLAVTNWCLDSGGFTELSKFGEWTVSPSEYVSQIRRFEKIGRLLWVAPQDWMCEPGILEKTKKTILEHQERTVLNFLELRSIAPDINFIPVLQGWGRDDYLRCWDMYDAQGVHLEGFDTVGIGTVCRRQGTIEAEGIIRSLQPLRLHGFGFKTLGLRRVGHLLRSADSLAWSFAARKGNIRLDGCSHLNCNSCAKWALQWRERVVSTCLNGPSQYEFGF